jgi:hypothetical protein
MNRHGNVTAHILFLAALFLSCAVPAAASDWRFSAEPMAGIRYGTLGEYVYTPDTNGTYRKLSELDWELKPAWYFGGTVSLGWRGMLLSASASGAVPGRTGSMFDSDWQNVTINGDADTKTNYSISENTLTASYRFGADLSYTFKPWKYVLLTPSAAVDYTYTSMEARNGYGWYADASTLKTPVGYSYTSDKAIYYASGELLGIDYKREDVLTWLGFTGAFTPVPQFTGTLSFFISPYAYVQSLDRHHTDTSGASNYYVDIMSGFFSVYRFETSGTYALDKNLSLTLAVSWLFSEIITGSDYYSTSSSGPWVKFSDVKSGADFKYTEVRFSLRYSLDF